MLHFLHHAQDNGMTNGEFAFFTHQLFAPAFNGWAWDPYDVEPEDRT